MTFPGFTDQDFDVFTVPGLEPRMNQLIEQVRPKLHELGDRLQPFLSALCGEPMFSHVAKHARRTVHPPEDTWVAWAPSRRGYKAHPHFQVGLWSTHLFIQFALIYESGQKQAFADGLEGRLEEIRGAIPSSFFWSTDHTKPDVQLHKQMTGDDFAQMLYKLRHVKKAEVLCGVRLERNDPLVGQGEALLETAERTFETLLPLYRLSY
ncbi:DUF1054 domain-containing protein [Paenibacillus aurantius]|uniref:UPF0637 protein MJA45_11515 n=1 Tax=Paenibacillus aurantius TaxID=2918900 RepID=A0AA96LHX8_9BACL|nr:DUF1054 domain-containing protein [Paenibacillus aurantius]WNQ13609.1 DUF1054 domain-containing protein [Paenibacillus aurantius]